MAKHRPTGSSSKTERRFQGAARDGGDEALRPRRLVRYPNTSNALRALLDDASADRMTVTLTPRSGVRLVRGSPVGARLSPSQHSRPSADAMRMILDTLPAAGSRPAGQSKPGAPFLPRLEPVQITDGDALGRMVRIRRQMLGLSQQALAQRAGVGRRFVGELEAGKPTIELRKAMLACRALGLGLTLTVSGE